MAAISRAVRETTGGLPRQFWWLWTSTLVNRLGGFVVTFLALYLTVQRGYSAAYAGLVAALFGLGGAAGAVLGGVLADRVGRRSTLLAAQLGAAVTTAVLGFVTDPVSIAAVATLVGLTGNASRPALSAMIADLVPAADRVRAFSLNYWAINIGFGVSAAAAGFIAAEGYLWLFLGDAFTTALCALLVYVKAAETLPAQRSGAKSKAAGKTSGGTLLDVVRDRRFMALAGLTFLFATVMQQASSTLAVDMGQHGLSARQFGLVAAVNGVVIVVLQMPVTRALRSRGSGVLLATGSVVLAWGIGLTVFATSVAVYALTVVIWTLGEIVHAPASMSVVADMAPPHARGRYQGMFTLAWSAAAFAGPLAGGLTLQYLGRNTVWLGCAALGTLAGAGYYLLLRPRTATHRPAAPVDAGTGRDLPVG
ncbi:MDR family MFS transporter [Actinacidiphila bryophytorum]|uniref:Predicted arabinose efflux permease, MFS family n=1 Tax=Actinacidiphila bryophytorum TaxID=1436133 RepID=A0A9W4GYQ8_9ACTN|nr:MFS transporter [Actinacidiphila bryophytorum]CAG7616176.1 Predicted arabinose efflux permease, MFS family [Actinacidiphila bryophytorum]